MKASILCNRTPAGVSISGRSGRECARTRLAPKASSTPSSSSSSSESDHLAPLFSRRHAAALLLASGASALLSLLLLGPGPAEAAASSSSAPAPAAAPTLSSGKRGIAAYVRKRRLDPLASYVPAVLAAREQLAGLEGLVASDPVEARIELRSGAFEGLRDNVRAVGEYATAAAAESSGNGGSSDNGSVKAFFASVQKLDYELFAAAREKRDPSGAAVEALRAGVAALDALLATVPAADLDEARRLLAKTAAAAQGEREKTTATKESYSSSETTTTTEAAAAAVSGDDDEKLRMLVPGAAR